MSDTKTKIKIGADRTGVTRTKTFHTTKNTSSETKRSGTVVGKLKDSLGDKKKKRLIPYIMVLLIFYLAMEIIFPEEEDMKVINPPTQLAKKIPPRPSKRVKGEDGQNVNEELVKEPSEPNTTTNLETETPELKETVEVAEVLEQPVASESEKEDQVSQEIIEKQDTETVSIGEKNEVLENLTVENTQKLEEVVDNSLKDNTKNDLEKLEEKIEESLPEIKENEEVATISDNEKEFPMPPDYDNPGRGLVYNCKGGHWACVDKSSYFQCLKNKRWSKDEEKTPSCVEFNVYASSRDCELAQVYNVNTVKQVYSCLN